MNNIQGGRDKLTNCYHQMYLIKKLSVEIIYWFKMELVFQKHFECIEIAVLCETLK